MLRRILVLGCLAVMIGGAAWVLYERSQTEPTKTPSEVALSGIRAVNR